MEQHNLQPPAIFSASRMQTLTGLTIVETNQDYSWLPRKLREELQVLEVWRRLRGSYRYIECGFGERFKVEGRDGRPLTDGDRYYVIKYGPDVWAFCNDTIYIKAGFTEEGEMGFKMYGYRNKLLESFQLQDGQLMNGRLTFEVKESKYKYNVTFGLDEAGRLERVVTMEVAAPTEEALEEMRRNEGWAPTLQNTSGQNIIFSCNEKFKLIK